MHCRVRIENSALDRNTNIFVGRKIGELCKVIAGIKLTAEDYVAIANMRYLLTTERRSEILASIATADLRDAVCLMPVYMGAYLLYVIQHKLGHDI